MVWPLWNVDSLFFCSDVLSLAMTEGDWNEKLGRVGLRESLRKKKNMPTTVLQGGTETSCSVFKLHAVVTRPNKSSFLADGSMIWWWQLQSCNQNYWTYLSLEGHLIEALFGKLDLMCQVDETNSIYSGVSIVLPCLWPNVAMKSSMVAMPFACPAETCLLIGYHGGELLRHLDRNNWSSNLLRGCDALDTY